MKSINRMIAILSVLVVLCLVSAVSASAGSVYRIGDTDNSGSVNVRDAALVQKSVVHLVELNKTQKKAGDVNKDNRVNIHDATIIQKYCAGRETGCQIGKYVDENELPYVGA